MRSTKLHQVACLILALVALSTHAFAEEKHKAITIPDENLREALLELKNKYEHKGNDITVEDLRNVYFLNVSGKGIRDLSGLEHCINLGEARLGNNSIVDVSPLAGCRNLQSLDVSHNEIRDITPLGEVQKLQYLNVAHNAIESLSGIGSLENLNSLYASHNKIESAEPVVQLQRLWSLDLSHNRISDMSPIAKLPRLMSLNLAHNQIQELVPLPGNSSMYLTDFRGNPFDDISPLVDAALSQSSGTNGFAQFWRLYLSEPLTELAQVGIEELRNLGVKVETSQTPNHPSNHATDESDNDSSKNNASIVSPGVQAVAATP